MTANALNIAAPNAAALKAGGPAGASVLGAANAAGKATGPLAGFEALLAALFPQADPTATTTAAATPAAPATTLAADATPGQAKAAASDTDPASDDEAKAALDAATDTAATAVVDPNAALAACGLATPAPFSPAAAKAPTGDAIEGDLLHGRVRPFRTFDANVPRPGPSGKTEEAPEAAPEAALEGETATGPIAEATTEPLPAPAKGPEASKSAPPAWGRDKAAGAPAAPALQNANPHAQLAQKAEPASEAPPPTAPAPTPAPSDAPVVAATPAPTPAPVRTEAPAAPVRTAKAGKTERAKGAAETADVADPKALAAAAKPASANAATAAAKPASAEAEAPEGKAHADKAEFDEPAATPTAETRAAAQSTTPLAHGSHAVRGSPETVATLAAQILKKLEGKSTRFDLELHPADLGKVNVRLEIGAQGALTAAMSFDNPQAAAELRSRASELQKALEQAGFNMAGGLTFDVAGDRGQQQQPGQAWQDQGEASGRAFRGQAFRAALDTAGDAAEAATSGALRLRRGVTAGLDVRI